MSEVLVVRSLRELDALVAEKLFGWKWYSHLKPSNFGPLLWETNYAGDGAEPMDLSPEPSSVRWVFQDALPDYATEAEDAKDVVGKMSPCYWRSETMKGSGSTVWMPSDRGEVSGSGPTLEVAICIAALATKGIRVQLELPE